MVESGTLQPKNADFCTLDTFLMGLNSCRKKYLKKQKKDDADATTFFFSKKG